MSSSKPLISVVIPAYNYAHTLRRAVMSVLPQLSARSELLVIDDGSTDSTPDVVASLLQESGDGFRSIRKKNGGLSSVRNRGIEEACGEFLVFLDADDELTPEALGLIETHIDAHPYTRMVIGGHIAVFPDGKRRLHSPASLPGGALDRVRGYLIEKRVSLSNGACAMHRAVFARGVYPERFRCAEDIPVFAQVLANFPCSVLAQPLVVIHKHDDSMRHQFEHAKKVGLELVDEVFDPNRLGPEFQRMRGEYYVQRCLSLFRSACLARDEDAAKEYFRAALARDRRVLLKPAYARKAARVWLRGLS